MRLMGVRPCKGVGRGVSRPLVPSGVHVQIRHPRVGNTMVVRAGRWYLDYLGGEVHDAPEWAAKLDEITPPVSVFGTLRVVQDDDGISISD